MRIVHVITSIDKSTGGPARSVTGLINSLLLFKKNCLTLFCSNSSQPIISNFVSEKGKIKFLDKTILGRLKTLEIKIENEEVDLMHGHGIWQMPVHQMAVYARNKNLPYVISPRGMLDAWSINHKSVKKKLALALYQKKDLKQAACLHATSKIEAKNIRNMGFKNPIAVIPNGISLPDIKPLGKHKKTRTVLFVARLVKNKGIEELLQAWLDLDTTEKSDWQLQIVGGGSDSYTSYLKNLVKFETNIEFLGPVYDQKKQNLFNKADIFVLPTYTENFGIVVAEALASFTPVITTQGAPWQELETENCGLWIKLGVEPLREALIDLMSRPQAELAMMGENGRQLVEKKYSMPVVAQQMLELYQWVLNKGEQPKSIYQQL